MTFWQFCTNAFAYLEARTTRIIALTLGTVTTLVGADVIPESRLKYWAAAISVLTFWRAQAISNTVTDARAIVAASKAQVPLAQPPPENAK